MPGAFLEMPGSEGYTSPVKGKLWELAPMIIAAAIAFGWAVGRRRDGPRAAGAVAAVPAPRSSAGPGDPTRPGDFRPDPSSRPDPNAPPDARVPADRSSTPDAGAAPAAAR